jgi:hypothetical protein
MLPAISESAISPNNIMTPVAAVTDDIINILNCADDFDTSAVFSTIYIFNIVWYLIIT